MFDGFPVALRWWVCGFAVVVLGGCASDSRGFLVVVENSLYEPLQTSLDVYAESIEEQGLDFYLERWEDGSVEELKELLFEHVDRHGIEGALLIGDLPAAWYQGIFNEFAYYEEFPTDLYLQDRDAVWRDGNGDGMFDVHSELNADIYTSRLIGTPKQLQDYFARVAYYRDVGSLVDGSAFIFLDDDWAHRDTSDLFHLGELYSTVEVIQDPADSTLGNYLEKLTGEGTEFVYHWIHGSDRWIQFDEPTSSIKLYAAGISDWNLKVSFLNMASCHSANFTEDSVAGAFTVGTSYGLAVIGSTKYGAATNARLFHDGLAEGMTWGQAYKAWYNQEGKNNHAWNLGIVLMGDPLLTVRGDLTPLSNAAPKSLGGD